MRPFVDIEIETINPTGAINRLHSLGLKKGDGIRLFTGTIVESIDNLFYFSFRVFKDRVHVIPGNNNPVFNIVRRSDQFDEDGNQLPKIMVDCERLDTETQQMVQYTQSIPEIA